MKILEIIPQLGSGGAERFTVDLCNELAQEHSVTLVVLYSLDSYGFYVSQLLPEVDVITLNKRSGLDVSLSLRLLKIIREISPDIVHSHLRSLIYLLPAAIFTRRTRFVHTVHNDAEKEASDILSQLIRKFLFRRKFVIPVTISDASRRSFYKFYKVNDAHIIYNGRNVPSHFTVPNDISVEFSKGYRTTPETRVIICLARINKVKRQLLLARIASKLAAEGMDFSLLFIGSTRDVELVSQIRTQMPACAHILGEKENPLHYLSLADAYCLFSEYEGLPISLIEALGCGCVPICTPVGGIRDLVVHEYNGILADDLTENGCYSAFKTFLELSSSELEKMSAKAKESYAAFTMASCSKKYIDLFNSCLH